jgi:CheY-like chemotaxis protein
MSEARHDTRSVVILVEEEAQQRAVLVEYLDQAGFAVLEADDSATGLALLAKTDRVRGFVTDAHVPGGIDGSELAARVRRDRPDVAVVLTSGHSDPTSGPVPDGVTFINKPNLLEYLAPTLRRLIGRRNEG